MQGQARHPAFSLHTYATHMACTHPGWIEQKADFWIVLNLCWDTPVCLRCSRCYVHPNLSRVKMPLCMSSEPLSSPMMGKHRGRLPCIPWEWRKSLNPFFRDSVLCLSPALSLWPGDKALTLSGHASLILGNPEQVWASCISSFSLGCPVFLQGNVFLVCWYMAVSSDHNTTRAKQCWECLTQLLFYNVFSLLTYTEDFMHVSANCSCYNSYFLWISSLRCRRSKTFKIPNSCVSFCKWQKVWFLKHILNEGK